MSHSSRVTGSCCVATASCALCTASSNALRLAILVEGSVRLSLRTLSSLSRSSVTWAEDACNSPSRLLVRCSMTRVAAISPSTSLRRSAGLRSSPPNLAGRRRQRVLVIDGLAAGCFQLAQHIIDHHIHVAAQRALSPGRRARPTGSAGAGPAAARGRERLFGGDQGSSSTA